MPFIRLTSSTSGRIRDDLSISIRNNFIPPWMTFVEMIGMPNASVEVQAADGVWRAAYLDSITGSYDADDPSAPFWGVLRLVDVASANANGWSSFLVIEGFRRVCVRARGGVDSAVVSERPTPIWWRWPITVPFVVTPYPPGLIPPDYWHGVRPGPV